MNVLISIDQLGNTLLLGDPDETISSRLGRIKRKHGGTIPWTRPVSRVTDIILDTIDPGHSDGSVENGHGGQGLLDEPLMKKRKKASFWHTMLPPSMP
jgi:hypothetical protein